MSSSTGLDNRLNLEEQFILRLPKELASKVGEMVRAGKMDADIQVKFAQGRNNRQGTLFFNNEPFKLTLADLPTVVETHKTLDGKTFFKSADVGQVLVVGDKDKEKEPGDPLKVKLSVGNKDEKDDLPRGDRVMTDNFELFDGLTPPTHNIRKRRFRKVPRYYPSDVQYAEEEINRQMSGGGGSSTSSGPRDDSTYEAISVEDVESILEIPSGVTIVLLKNGPPFKSGPMGVAWTNEELAVLPTAHRSRLENQGGLAIDKDDDDELDDMEIEKDLPELPQEPVAPPRPSPASGGGAQNESEVRRLRLAKIELTKKYNTLSISVKKLSISARNERNGIMKQRLEEQVRSSNAEIEAVQAEMTKLDGELAKLGAN